LKKGKNNQTPPSLSWENMKFALNIFYTMPFLTPSGGTASNSAGCKGSGRKHAFLCLHPLMGEDKEDVLACNPSEVIS